MHRLWRPVSIVAVIVVCGAWVTASYLTRSGKNEGRPDGMAYASVRAKINAEEAMLAEASRMFSLPPRILGAAIAAELAFNFQPYLEDIGDAIFGTSVGLSQVNTVAFREILTELYLPDSSTHFRMSAAQLNEARAFFRISASAQRYERKLRLLLDTRFNITAAALLLRHSLDRYEMVAPQYDVFHRPDLAATLYHRTFPKEIRGIPDTFGLMALQFYSDTTFMPRSVARKEVSLDRRN